VGELGLTIKDVAKKANVSVTTVSRVLNNKGRISESTRNKVLQIVDDIGYQPRTYNLNNEIKTIAFVFNNRYLTGLTNNPFYGEVVNGLEQVLKKHDYNPVLKTISGNEENESEDLINFLKNSTIEGIVLLSYEIDKEVILQVKKMGKPFVLVDNDLWEHKIDCIVNDNLTGAREVVNHLIELGHKKIVFMGGPLKHASLQERFAGYQTALEKAGIDIDEKLIHFCDPYMWTGEAYEVARKMLENKENGPTAFFAVADNLAIAIMKAVSEMGYTIPDDISIAGFDDTDIAVQMHPGLTTVRIFKERMGLEAGERLIELINGEKKEPVKQIIGVEVIKRKSTGPCQ